jgi:hypothetical protein
MGLFKKVLGVGRKLLPVASLAAGFIPGGGLITKGITMGASLAAKGKAARALLPLPGKGVPMPSMPTAGVGRPSPAARAGRIAGGAASAIGTVATGKYIYDQFGNVVGRRRSKSGKGLSGRDIKGCVKVGNLLRRFGCKPQAAMRRPRKKGCR